jgi:tetratricopeptide (TPR) repeat protein
MTTHRHYLIAFAFAALVLTGPAAAENVDLGKLVTDSLKAMNECRWEDALADLNTATAPFAKGNADDYGPQFGVLYYRRGICELKLKRWHEAMKSFELCNRRYPNAGGKFTGGNVFGKRALLKWGEAALGAEDWALAIRQFDRYLAERDEILDVFQRGSFYINRCIAHFKLGNVAEGTADLEIAIANKENFPTAATAIVAGFQAFAGAAIKSHNEQALLDFIAKNRADISLEPFEMTDFTKLYLKLANDAIGADMPQAAMALYQLVPSTEAAFDDTKARLEALGPKQSVKDVGRMIDAKNMAENLKSLEADLRGPKSPEITKLTATAYLHEVYDNPRGAYAAYEQLELHYPNAEMREDNLYNLVRTASIISEVFATARYGQLFLRTYPNSKNVPRVRRMLLSSLFYEGEYKTCIEVASAMIDQLARNTLEHDLCLHVLGGSYYYTGEYQKALPVLDHHLELYPQSQFAEAARYYQASNLSRLQDWKISAKLLDAFLAKYPDPKSNIFYPFALYDRANCHYAEDEHDTALDKLETLATDFPNTEVMEQALNLRGNVQQTLGSLQDAEKSYLAALALAESRGNSPVAGEALYYLVALLGTEGNPRSKEAVPYADRFWKDHADNSPYRTQMAVAQWPALDEVGRGGEGLGRLWSIVMELAQAADPSGLEFALNSFVDLYLKKHKLAELREFLFNGPIGHQPEIRAVLRMALILGFESALNDGTPKPDDKIKLEALVNVLFRELKSDFTPATLTPYILLRVGNHLATGSPPREALPYYDEINRRKDATYQTEALLRRGGVNARSDEPAHLDEAIADFDRVINLTEDKSLREQAIYEKVKALIANQDWFMAETTAKFYLDRDRNAFTKHLTEVTAMLARTYEERDSINDAIALYQDAFTRAPGRVGASVPALKRWMELMWRRNLPAKEDAQGRQLPGDRQAAYAGGARFIAATSRAEFQNKLTPEAKAVWRELAELVKQYETAPDIRLLPPQ